MSDDLTNPTVTHREELILQLGFLIEQEQQSEVQKHGPGERVCSDE